MRARQDFRFQWWDKAQDCWRDTRTDEERERAQLAVALLDAYLGSTLPSADLDRITAHWHRHGPPDNVKDRILQVQQAPSTWQSLLQTDEPANDHRPDRRPSLHGR